MKTDTKKTDKNQMKSVMRAVQHAAQGAGPLLRRDYWGVIHDSKMSPEEIMRLVRTQFATFAPKELAAFSHAVDAEQLDADGEMDIEIPMAGSCRVRVVDVSFLSFTLRTLEGHPEAGRITFGAERNESGRIVFRIRSRARSGSPFHLLGYTLVGQSLQTSLWLTFVQRVAAACNGTLEGVFEDTQEVAEDLADHGELDTPTFVAHPQPTPKRAA